jgi:hypothetical protein
MTKILHALNTLLLLGIFAALVIIVHRMPITLGDLKNATRQDRQALLLRQSLVHLEDTVSVEVENTPLSVEIER